MKSELVNHLPISLEAKIFLRAVVEKYIWGDHSEMYPEVDYTKGLSMTYIFVDSKLSFATAYYALEELRKLNLVDINAHRKRDCDLNLTALLRFIKDSIKDEESDDYEYISDLIEEREAEKSLK